MDNVVAVDGSISRNREIRRPEVGTDWVLALVVVVVDLSAAVRAEGKEGG